MGVDVKRFTPTLMAYNDYAFITDDVNQVVVIIAPTEILVHKYSDIVSVSYTENGSDVFNKSVGGAIAGGLLFGKVGAVVGSVVGDTTKSRKIRSMTIKILLKNTTDSSIILKIYNAEKDEDCIETDNDKERAYYEKLMKGVAGIEDIFAIIIDIVEKTQAHVEGIVDELAKLAKLKKAGVLTEDEFNEQKEKLLNR